MKLPKTITKLSTLITAIVVVIYSVSILQTKSPKYISTVETVAAASNSLDELEEVEKELAKLKLKQQELANTINSEKNKQGQYGAEIAKLSGEISLRAVEIQTLELDIEKLTLQIEILTFSISDTEKTIKEKENSIKKLEDETSERLISMYIDTKSYSDSYIIFNPESSVDFVKNDLYQKTIQEDTNSSLSNLNTQREELNNKKKQLSEDKVQIEKDKTLVDEQKIALEKEKTVLDQSRALLNQKIRESLDFQKQQEFAYDQSSDEEKKLLAEAEYLKQQIFNQIGSVPTGSYVIKGTIIGAEGNTGWSTGPHLHFGTAQNGVTQNPCNFVNCSSLSDGELKWPISPRGTITSGYGQRAYDFHAAIDISTGGSGAILAAHDGWITYGKQYCYDLTWVKCNGGFAYYAIICEDKTNCNNGFKTVYWHLKF